MEIVNTTSELCDKLSITRFRPREVVWAEWNPASTPIWLASTIGGLSPPTFEMMRSGWGILYREGTSLGSTLKEQLTQKEGKPIIRFTLIYNFDPHIRWSQ